ncbi:MAG TPA: hypothetical protein VH419_16355 [Nocardioidaceae bacterium]|jgi:uncharacterized membrane protein HdeD (DUF308 family)
MRVRGVIMMVLGLALAAYSVPFVTGVAFAAFLLGVALVVFGVRLILRSGKARSEAT